MSRDLNGGREKAQGHLGKEHEGPGAASTKAQVWEQAPLGFGQKEAVVGSWNE